MGRYRKTFIEAAEYVTELMNTKEIAPEKVAKKAASVYHEDIFQLKEYLNGNKITQKKAETDEEPEDTSHLLRFEYNGPVDVICLNGGISTINIDEIISDEDKNDSKERFYERLFNNRLPIFIKSSD